MSKKYTYGYLLALFSLLVSLTSCIDKDLSLIEDEEYPFEDKGPVMSFYVTLDVLGSDGISTDYNPLQDIENFVDPRRFRILFFDNEEKFLFESKSRWVKQLDKSADHETWKVSVPFFTYGNDIPYDWKWKDIREAVTSNKFKIAILVNRPEWEWHPEIKDSQLPQNQSAEGWFDNTGPHWDASDTGKKKIFDLHHAQYDPVYHAKSYVTNTGTPEEYYDFIFDVDPQAKDPNWKSHLMGSTISWVTWTSAGYPATIRDHEDQWGLLYARQPDRNFPIPMYGIQEYEALTEWEEGTTFDLNRDSDNPVSLLRSVVKLELLVPDYYDKPECCLLWYPNIYSRCEPMDIWTPTDQIWKPHAYDDDGNEEWQAGVNCEWQAIKNYGPISDRPSAQNTGKERYQKKLSWIYGIWNTVDPTGARRWNFGQGRGGIGPGGVVAETADTPYPRVFNPCIQRNTAIDLQETYEGTWDGYHHYIVYTGERNINDPSNLYNMGYNANGSSPVEFFMVNLKRGNQDYLYAFPLTDLDSLTQQQKSIIYKEEWTGEIPNNGYKYGESGYKTESVMGTTTSSNAGAQRTGYEDLVIGWDKNYPMPWPLIRNHYYKFTISTPDTRRNTRSSGPDDIGIKAEKKHTPDINFKRKEMPSIQIKDKPVIKK